MKNLPNPVKIFASAGEVSGEKILAQVLIELRSRLKVTVFKGLGGIECGRAGLKSLVPLKKLAVNGIWDVLIRFPFFLTVYLKVGKTIKQFQPDLVILVDYPGLNKRLLRLCKKQGIPVYYISPPQIWAYKTRKTGLFENVHVQVLFIWEKDSYRLKGAKVSEGHFFQMPGKERTGEKAICICPGGRLPVIKRNLPLMVNLIRSSKLDILREGELIVLVPPELSGEVEKLYGKLLDSYGCEVASDSKLVFPRVGFAIAFPGTITLELALWDIPTLVFGKIDTLTYLVGKLLLRSCWLSIPNILSGQNVFPELVSWRPGISRETFDSRFHLLEKQSIPKDRLREALGPAEGQKIAGDNCMHLLRFYDKNMVDA
ncbi:hypothetical protein ACFL5V_08635 [Fibrobacterota bacterium]